MQLNIYCRHLYFMKSGHELNCRVSISRECTKTKLCNEPTSSLHYIHNYTLHNIVCHNIDITYVRESKYEFNLRKIALTNPDMVFHYSEELNIRIIYLSMVYLQAQAKLILKGTN